MQLHVAEEAAFDEIKAELTRMGAGVGRCHYREDSMADVGERGHFFPFVLTNNSRTSTSSAPAILNSVSTLGCILFEHHRETVDLSRPTCLASQELLLSFSARTILMRLYLGI
jgi:hypothetical protein